MYSKNQLIYTQIKPNLFCRFVPYKTKDPVLFLFERVSLIGFVSTSGNFGVFCSKMVWNMNLCLYIEFILSYIYHVFSTQKILRLFNTINVWITLSIIPLFRSRNYNLMIVLKVTVTYYYYISDRLSIFAFYAYRRGTYHLLYNTKITLK